MQQALLVGFGDIANRLAPLLTSAGYQVTGVCRQPATKTTSVSLVAADASQESSWKALLRANADGERPALIVLTLTPSEYTEQGYHAGYVVPMQSLTAVISSIPHYQPLVVFVSSTSVYGERDGEWVNELTPAKPSTASGTQVLAAEKLTAELSNHLIVRFSGIYGPGREGMIARLVSGRVALSPAWTNRIHADDCAGVLAHLIGLQRDGELAERVFLASDSRPVTQREFISWLAPQLGIDAANLPTTEEIGPRGSKRCDNSRLLATGYEFIHPDFTSGYGKL